MANRGTIRVDGLAELGAKLRALSDDVRYKIARAAANAGAQVIKKEAQTRAPIGTVPHKVGKKGNIVPPGNLRRNIYVKRLPLSQRKHTEDFIVAVRQGGKSGKDAFYWRFLEYGTVKMAAQPFMRPAFSNKKQQAAEAMRERLRQRIQKAERTGR